jgi:glutamate dehydrogenase/leucine dehydrogenase
MISIFGSMKKKSDILNTQVLHINTQGKALEYGGSLIRPEATGYGSVYFSKHMSERIMHKELKDQICAVSGSGESSKYQRSALRQGRVRRKCMVPEINLSLCKISVSRYQYQKGEPRR